VLTVNISFFEIKAGCSLLI